MARDRGCGCGSRRHELQQGTPYFSRMTTRLRTQINMSDNNESSVNNPKPVLSPGFGAVAK
ncbi:hypothetical protein PHAMO_320081 [Magnetospirillum molischianum DSM 120]|uniref:Uncharacterized protein n=1 Tax=Magnetospirillum molischianum DSM 120 TaxID=1150626 RepID=H8FUS4_MAGML|nr:hypothetical protein PHAMO_320081 [Magnetospirillum molischianum DSM 120]